MRRCGTEDVAEELAGRAIVEELSEKVARELDDEVEVDAETEIEVEAGAGRDTVTGAGKETGGEVEIIFALTGGMEFS
jgi:hypothetical protein